jgi:nitroimidazol reductase NimA-like FMN-containing flavoprotein (pyridoxamine 5'-phosphate oxidase superfamily)
VEENAMTQPSPSISRPQMPASYGIDPAQRDHLLAWSWVEEQMRAARNYWVISVTPEGRPHAAPVWGVWHEGALYFGSDLEARKARNLAANPALTVHLESGDEVVILEGEAEFVRDQAVLDAAGAAYAPKYQMRVADVLAAGALIRLKPRRAMAWLEKDFPNTATRWTFVEG